MSDININDVIPDGLLQAPLVLAKNFEQPLAKMKEFIALAKEYNALMGTSAKTVGDHKKKTEELAEQEKVLATIKKQVITESAKQTDVYREQVQILSDLKTKGKELAANQDVKKHFEAEHASITELNKALTSNRVAYSALRGEHERNSATGKKLLKTIQEQDESLKKLKLSIGTAREESGKLGESLAQMFERSGEGGEKVLGIMSTLKGALVSGWTAAGAAIGVASFALQQFFEKTDTGEILWAQKVDLMSIKWDQFKNKIASSINVLVPDDEQRASTRRISYLQSKSTLENQISGVQKAGGSAAPIIDRLNALNKEYALEEEIYSLATQRHKIEEEEIPLIVKRVEKLDKAKEAELRARDSLNPNVGERLKDALEMESLFKEVHDEDMMFAEKRAGVANQEIYLRAQGRELMVAERAQIEKNIAAVVQLELEFDSAEKKRQKLIQSLTKKSDKEEFDYKGYESDQEKLAELIKKRNEEDAKAKLESDKEFAANKKASDDLMFKIDEQRSEEEHDKIVKRWDAEFEFKKLLKEKELDLAKTTSDAIVSTVNQQFDAQIAREQFHLNQVRENYQQEMEMSSGNKIAQAQLTAKFREDEKRAQKEMLLLRRKEVEFNKIAGELLIVIKTGEAIMKDVAAFPLTAGEPFAAIDAAIGAVQLAAIMAKPLPSYEFGTNDHKGGKAIVGEKGFELYSTPTGNVGLTPNRTSIIDLPKGSEVKTHDETLQILALAGLNNLALSDRQQNNPNDKVIEELREVKKAIEEQKNSTTFYSTMSGYYAFKKESESFAKKIMIERFGNI